MPVEVVRHATPDVFLERAGGFLAARESEHTVLYSVVGRLRRTGGADGPAGYLATAERDGDILAVAGRSPPLVLVLSTTEHPEAVRALASDVAASDEQPPGVMGPEPAAGVFAEEWTALTGTASTVEMRMRLFECRQAAAPQGVPGRYRPARAEDRDVLVEWLGAFEEEAIPSERRTVEERREAADRLLRGSPSSAHLWEDGGRPVSMAVSTVEPRASPRVGGVYTPPALRRRGYAEACTAAATQRLLAEGHPRVLLFTDLANPTSNAIYTRIGYRPLGDFSRVLFT